jgi:hypothetical protein
MGRIAYVYRDGTAPADHPFDLGALGWMTEYTKAEKNEWNGRTY